MTDNDDDKKRIKQRNLAVAGVLVLMVIMFFVTAILKVQESLNAPG